MPVPAAAAAVAAGPTSPAPRQAPYGTVPLRIETSSSKHLEVSLLSDSSKRCEAPCTLDVPPGTITLVVQGDAEFTQQLEVPNRPSTAVIETRSGGRLVTGLVLFSIGGVIGIYLTANQKDASEISVAEARSNLYLAIAGLGFTVTGAVLALTAGKNQASISRDLATRANAPRLAFWAAPTPGGGGMAGAALRF